MKLTSVGINNGLANEVEQHPIVISELVRPITTYSCTAAASEDS
jgi:hypothetical protein